MAECNKCLPLETFVKVDITIENTVDQEQFNCLAILTSDLTGGEGGAASVVDATNTVKDYFTLSAVADDWDSSSDFYQSALHAFAQTPSVATVKAMYIDLDGDIQGQLDSLFECEECQGIVIPELRDDPAKVLAVADWVEARKGKNFYFTDTNDVLTLDSNDATSIAALIQAAQYKYTSAYYHSDPTEQFASAALSFGLGQDLDLVGSAFTMAFNELALVSPDFITTEQLVGATGNIPATGCSADFGHFANVYTCVNNQNTMLYGSMGDGNFFDTYLLSEYVKARITESLSQLFVNGSVPLNNNGSAIMANQVDFILDQFQSAGWIDSYIVQPFDVESLAPSERKCRVLGCTKFKAQLTGRVHSTCVLGEFIL